MTTKPSTERSAQRALHRLAQMYGVQRCYTGTDHRRHEADDEVVAAVLAAMGVGLEGIAEAPDVLRASLASSWRKVLEPVVVQRGQRPARSTVVLDAAVDPADVWVSVRSEDGEFIRRRLSQLHGRLLGRIEGDGSTRTRIEVEVGGPDTPLGYHELTVEGPQIAASALLVCAPLRLPSRRASWGLSVPLYALRTPADWGVGSFADLAEVARWVETLGGDLVGTLPLYAALLDEPCGETSPYLPASRLAWNELYVDVESEAELDGAPEARTALASPLLRNQLRRLRHSRLAHPAATVALKRRLLEPMARVLADSDARCSPRRRAFEAFVASHPELGAYARFRAQRERHGTCSTPGAASSSDGSTADIARDDVVWYHLYVQWLAESQLAAAAKAETGVGLYLDLPVGVHPEGFDVSWEPEAFVAGVSGGAPPDAFFSGGQCWGFPPLHPERIRQQGYRHVIAVLRQAMRHAAALRLDHVMGLHRMYWVPQATDARHGVYVRYPSDELYAVVALEAERSGTVVVGEDLGTVPSAVERAMARDGMLASFVVQFESTIDNPLPAVPRRTLASLGTHDLAPFAAYWEGLDISERAGRGLVDEQTASVDRRRRARWRDAVLGTLAAPPPGGPDLPSSPVGEDPEERGALAGCLEYLAASPADIVMIDLEDLWLERTPQNRPGTGAQERNFQRRAARNLDEVRSDAELTALLRAVDARRQQRSVDRRPGGGQRDQKEAGA